MPPLAQVIADRFLGQQVNLLRLSASERDKVFTMLGALQARLLSTMDSQIPLPGFETFTQNRLNALYQLTDKLIQQQYGQIGTLHTNTLLDVSGFQGSQALKIINAVIGVPLMTVGVTAAAMKALVNDDLVDGRPASYWWQQQAATLQTRYRDEIRQGVFAGETLGQLKQRIRGTKAQNFQDGLMALTSRNADALIRTSLLSVANAARYETLKANDDVLDGQQWMATLDDRTCPICQALDAQSWDFDGAKMGDTQQDFPGPPPQHFNCRCTLVPVLKSWAQLQRDAGQDDKLGKKLDAIERKIGPGTRASMDGQVSGKMTYEDWLKQQDVSMQRDILGAKRFDLWQQGLVDVQDLVTQQNRPLNLDQIKARAAINQNDPLNLPSIAFGKANPDGLDSLEQYQFSNGALSADRQALHEAIKQELFAEASAVDNPTAYLLGGGPATGKSTFRDSGAMGLSANSVTIDSDVIKAKLPEYRERLKANDPTAAAFVHEESSLLAKQLLRDASDGQYNMVYDGTGDGSIDSLSQKVAIMRANGAKVEAHYLTIPTDLAIERAQLRAEETGRAVPEALIKEAHAAVSLVFPEAIKRGLFDKFYLWDSTSREPVLIAKGEGKNIIVRDEAKWRAFLRKAGR